MTKSSLLAAGVTLVIISSASSESIDPPGPGAPSGVAPPGAAPRPPELVESLDAAVMRHGLPVHAVHAQDGGWPRYTNRLALESSPYLLQHAHNPVDWYPWGEEAFERARQEGRPVLLSIGYSTCHWCHVMERESFEDLAIAEVMNSLYIPIKVDREERPDIDGIYMSAVQIVQGRGGWPMTVWLKPDRRPFHADTYIPARDGDRGVRVGFLTMLHRLRQVYDAQPDQVAASASGLTDAIRRVLEPEVVAGDLPGGKALHSAVLFFGDRFDAVNGGLKGAPKFPSSLPIRLLLRHHRRTENAHSLEMAVTTLERMAAGGMYDQIGGGFHRYSVDSHWLVPHFEKMLYDNALLTLDYLEGHQASGRKDLADVAREILAYIEREMTSDEGLFYSATDADSEGEEGIFFVWSPQEIEAALGKELARVATSYWGVTKEGNFERANILHRSKPVELVATELGLSLDALEGKINEAKGRLYDARSLRVPPQRDEKVLAAWNGLMVSAHARAAIVLREARYARIGERAMRTLLLSLRGEGRLHRSWAAGKARHDAVLDDYAFVVAACLDLFEATWDRDWLREAITIQATQDSLFSDEGGGYRFTAVGAEELLARERPSRDGALPSGNSVSARNLYRLAAITTDDAWRAKGDALLKAFASSLERSPASLAEMLLAVDFRDDAAKELVIVAPDGSPLSAKALLDEAAKVYCPNLVVVGNGRSSKGLALLNDRSPIAGRATAYVCRGGVCNLPTNDPAELARQLGEFETLELD